MKIKIIDLVIKIIKEEAPKAIKFQDKIWDFDNDTRDYTSEKEYLFFDYMSDYACIPENLNEEIEIIEEEKEIEKLGKKFTLEGNTSELTKSDWQFSVISQKINELVDEVNKLKKEKN